MTLAAAPQQCPVCDVDPVATLTLSNGEPLLRCPRCLLGWWNWPAFSPPEFYDESYFQSVREAKGYNDYRALESGQRRTARSRLSALAHAYAAAGARARPTRLLDVGCGTGVFVDQARRQGWGAVGIEVSGYAAAAARARGLNVTCESIEQFSPPAEAYDCVTMWDVIEHLRDPVAALSKMASALRPCGVLALSTGDITAACARFSGSRWHLFNLPEHLYFFSPKSLRGVLRQAGLTVVAVRRELNWFSAGYLLERLVKSIARKPAGIPGWLNNAVLPVTLLDVISVYAQRRV